jgi:hypothetical protein
MDKQFGQLKEQIKTEPHKPQMIIKKAKFKVIIGLFVIAMFSMMISRPSQAGTSTVDVTDIINAQGVTIDSMPVDLNDQVLTGSEAVFHAILTASLKNNDVYYLRWKFMGTTSEWIGPYNSSSAEAWHFSIPADATHKLKEPITVEVRLNTDGNIHDSYRKNMRVFFNSLGNGDTHNRPAGNTDANWFRHYGTDQDNAVDNYSASSTVSYGGKAVTFIYGGSSGDEGSFNLSVQNPIITLYDAACGGTGFSFSSNAMPPYTDSTGKTVNAPAGALTVSRANLRGIDNLKRTVGHELEHLNIFLKWLPGGQWYEQYGSWNIAVDQDRDLLPNAVEDGIIGLRWDVERSQWNFYLNGSDREIWCELASNGVGNGNASNDWAFPGKQSTPKH